MKPLNKNSSKARQHRFIKLFLLLALLSSVLAIPGFSAAGTGLDISCEPRQASVYQGEKIVFTMTVTNRMLQSIRPGENYFISYHLYSRDNKLIAYDNRRFRIPRVLRRQKTTSFELQVFFDYAKSGDYRVEWDIVKEGEFWGSSKKWRTCSVSLHLKPLFSEEFKKKYLKVFHPTGQPLLDREQYLLRLILKNSEIRGADGEIFGFSPGSAYPAVWIRDTATFMAYAKLFYPFPVLADCVKLFMERQSADGEVADWVDIDGKTDKNTVETDQESSLVLAAYELAEKNPAWLRETIQGKTVRSRLEMALEWVWKNKRSPGYGLICSGFTADWGDLENTYPDQRATKLSDRSTPVLSIYTNALYIRAIDCLVKLLKSSPDAGGAPKWQKRRDALKTLAQKHLYLQDRGYFIAHIVPSNPGKYFKLEKEMLAIGGNAEAILAGLMDERQVRRFLEELEKRRKEYRLQSISFTLIPPYPEGFFPHPLMARPWSYQNGGQWDWIGARVVKALFLKGFRKEAEKYLLEIVQKNLDRFAVNEWEDRQGNPQGADFYVGAAGVIGEAILTGYAPGGQEPF